MRKSRISIIVAMDEKRGIGKNNGLLWHIPEELKRFREITTGHPVIMGRKTYESIGRPLPKRTNIVITRDPEFKAEGCIVVNSLEEAVEVGQKLHDREIFVIGGGQIYQQAMDSGIVDKLYVTVVSGEFQPTVFLPEFEHIFKKKISEKEIEVEGTKDGKSMTFKVKFLELEKD